MYRTRRLVYFLSNIGKANLRRNQYRIEFQRLEENREKEKQKNEVYIMCVDEYHPLFDSENENQIKNGNKEKFRACSKCKKSYPLNDNYFTRNQSTNTGGNKYYRPECKECSKELTKNKNTAFNLAGRPETPIIGTPCRLCRRTDQKLVFDHDHKTLKHRGWICDACNRGLGMLGDTVGQFERVLCYLKGENLYD